jgi:hypothetical protein
MAALLAEMRYIWLLQVAEINIGGHFTLQRSRPFKENFNTANSPQQSCLLEAGVAISLRSTATLPVPVAAAIAIAIHFTADSSRVQMEILFVQNNHLNVLQF